MGSVEFVGLFPSQDLSLFGRGIDEVSKNACWFCPMSGCEGDVGLEDNGVDGVGSGHGRSETRLF